MKISNWLYSTFLAIAIPVLAIGCIKLPEPATSTAPIKEASMPVGELSDVDVTEHVKMALQQSELLKATDISVTTLKGDVRLIGLLESQVQIDEAIKIARNAAGAHTIHDELTLKK